MEVFLTLVVAYLVGAIPSGVLLTRIAGTADIRSQGSGNVGATNVYRVAGKRLGILTLVADVLKGVLPLLLVRFLVADGILNSPPGALLEYLTALALFLGHCYPVYLGFKGGKGVATALGVFLVLAPVALLPSLGTFILVLWRWRYVSLASISAAAVMPIAVFASGYPAVLAGVTGVIAAMVIYRHSANIQRLLQGSENRFNF